MQRTDNYLAMNDPITLNLWIPTTESLFSKIEIEVDYYNFRTVKNITAFDQETLDQYIKKNHVMQPFVINQNLILNINNINLTCKILNYEIFNSNKINSVGLLTPQTIIDFKTKPDSPLRITGTESKTVATLIKSNWSFEEMGIGGLDKEFSDIFRRAFASRVYPPAFIAKLGIRHVKGIMLYGPPGTGKTLMARQIGKMMNGKEPKIVNGPEILNKYVGQSEENIRNLFKEAEKEYTNKKDESDLHIIIFDEIDAIAGARGTHNNGTGVADTIVNQLLSKMDGVDQLNNILIIGMTNRLDMIDEALLRPGRFELHMEIGLPDENGRLQIFKIHTAKMANNNFLSSDIKLEELAKQTRNFSGAEIEGLIRCASSFAMNRNIDYKNLGKKINLDNVVVLNSDFDSAFGECKAAYGVAEEEFQNKAPNGIIHFSKEVTDVIILINSFVSQVANSKLTSVLSVLIHGKTGSGKTAIVCDIAMKSKFPFIKLLSGAGLLGLNEVGKCARIRKTFEDAYRSPSSIIVIDDLERILEYVNIGPRFSNSVLQTLLVLLKQAPPKNRKLLILCTATDRLLMNQLGLSESFDAFIQLPLITKAPEIATVLHELSADIRLDYNLIIPEIPIKKLIFKLETARNNNIDYEMDFLTSLTLL